MKHYVRFCLFVWIWRVGTAIEIEIPQIQIYPPSGIMFKIPDDGYDIVGVHYSINTPLLNVNAGRWNFDITEKTGDVWIHINPEANVSPGDVVNYWLYAIVNRTGNGIQLINHAFTLQGTTTPSQPTMSGNKTKGTTTTTITTTTSSQPIMSGNKTKGTTTTPSQPTISGNNTKGPTTPSQPTISSHNTQGTTTPSTGNVDLTTDYGLIGAVTGIILAISLIILTVVCLYRKRRHRRPGNKNNSGTKLKNEDNILQNITEISARFNVSNPSIPKTNIGSTNDMDSEEVYDYIQDDDLTKALPTYDKLISQETQEYDRLQKEPVNYLEPVTNLEPATYLELVG